MERNASIANGVVMILAAGLASRLGGRSKPDLIWEGCETLLHHQVRLTIEAGFQPLVVSRVPRPELWSVVNASPEKGIAGSLKAGLASIREQRGDVPVGVLLADQPFVTVDDIRVVWRAFMERPPGIHAVRPRYGSIPGHPVFFDAAWDPVVASLMGDRGIGAVWQQRDDVCLVSRDVVGRPSPSFDIDTVSNYHQALKWARTEGDGDEI